MSHRTNIEEIIPDLKNRRILDMGCGRGSVLLDFAKHGYDIVGIDVNEAYLTTTRERARAEGIPVTVQKGVAEHLPFPDESFGFINCNEVTEHVEDLDAVLKECARVLRRGGTMYVSFHNRFGFYDRHYHLPFINWMPRSWADAVIEFLHKSKKDSRSAGRQVLSEMHYRTYAQAAVLLKKYGFRSIDTRQRKLYDPKAVSRSPVVKIARAMHAQWFALWTMRNFASAFHFIATKE